MGNVVFDQNGIDQRPLDAGMRKWTFVSGDNYVREYVWKDFAITLVGDFGVQGETLAKNTLIAGLEFHNTITGKGAKVFGFKADAGDLYRYFDLDTIMPFGATVTGSGVKDYIDLVGGRNEVFGRGGNDYIEGAGNADILFGQSGKDQLFGGGGNDRLNGGTGDDRLYGDYGSDRLTGGAGSDLFIYKNTWESYATVPGNVYYGGTERDIITDFQKGRDKIDLSHYRKDVFGFNGIAWHFQWRGEKDLRGDGHADLVFRQISNKHGDPKTIIEGNEDKDAKPEFQLVLLGHIDLTASDFLL